MIRHERCIRILKDYNLEELCSNAVEFGCGTGEFLLVLKNLGFRGVGIELSEEAVKQCKEKGLEVHRIDLSEQEVPFDEEFDIGFALEVLEHVYDPFKFLFNVNKSLKKGGWGVFTTPNFHSYRRLFCYLFKGQCPSQLENVHHIRFYSKDYLRELLAIQGFTVLDINCGIKPKQDLDTIGKIISAILPGMVSYTANNYGAKLYSIVKKESSAKLTGLIDLDVSKWHC